VPAIQQKTAIKWWSLFMAMKSELTVTEMKTAFNADVLLDLM